MNETDILDKFTEINEFSDLREYGIRMHENKNQFDIIEFFDAMFNENAWSDIFSYLLSSKKKHALGQLFFREWFSNIDNTDIKHFVRKLPSIKNSDTITIREWRTDEGRRIDIMLLVKDENNKTHTVIGIENKLDSKEGEQQLMDYQNAIEKRYSACENKILLFLTPNGRNGTTSNENLCCPCIPISYLSIKNACEKILRDYSNPQVELLLTSIKSYIVKMTNVEEMNEEISSLVKEIYKDQDNRKAINLLINYLPNITSTLEDLEKKYSKKRRFEPLIYRDSKTTEFKLHTTNLDMLNRKLKVGFCYMLHFDGSNPDIDDVFVLRLFMYIDKKLPKEKIKELREYFEFEESINEKKDWWNWKTIWTGDSYKLVDLDGKDLEGLIALLESGIEDTYVKLQNKIKNYKK